MLTSPKVNKAVLPKQRKRASVNGHLLTKVV